MCFKNLIRENNLIQKSEMNVGGLPSTNHNLQSMTSEDRRSPSEGSNVSTGNTPVTDIKEEPSGRSSSRNSNSAEVISQRKLPLSK